MKNFKRTCAVLLSFSLLCSHVPPQIPNSAKAAAIKTYKVEVGKTFPLYLLVNGKRIKPSKVKYTSKNKKIAKVSKKGIVKGIKKGTTKIYLKYKKYSAVCKVKVIKKKKNTAASPTVRPTARPTARTVYNTPTPSLTPFATKIPDGNVTPPASDTAVPITDVSASFDPKEYVEAVEEHENQGSISDTPRPVSTSIPGETGIRTSIRVSTQEINSAPKSTASVTQNSPQAKAGDVTIDFGSYNLKEDTTLTIRTLPEKTDQTNGYTASIWSLDAGSQKEFILPISVTVPYDPTVKDPETELEAQCWNEDTATWENISFEFNTSARTITLNLYRASLFGIFRAKNAAEEMDDSEPEMVDLYRKAGKDLKLSINVATKLLPTKASYDKYAKLINTSLSKQKFEDILNSRLTDPLEYKDVLSSMDLITNISNVGNVFVSFSSLICQEKTGFKSFLTGTGAMLCGVGLGITAMDYAKKTISGGQSNKDYLLDAWPELLLSAASIPESLGAVAGFINGTGAAASAAAAAGTTTFAPWLTAIAGVAVLAKYQLDSQKEPPKIEYAELLSLMRVMAEETYFNPKTGKLHTYLPEAAVNRLQSLGTSDYAKYGLKTSAVSTVLSNFRPDSWKSNYVRLGNSRYPNYNGWAEVMDFITKKNKKHPEKWIEELEGYAWAATYFSNSSPAEVNALAYAFLGESALGLGDRYFGAGKDSYTTTGKCSQYIQYEVMDGLKNNNFFKRFSEKFMDKVKTINRRNWKKQIKELKRELTFTLVNKNGMKVSFSDLAEYKDKFICFETAPTDFTLRTPWRVNMDSPTLSVCTYFGYVEMGGRVQELGKNNTENSTHYLLVYDNAEDCIRGADPVSRIAFTGPKEYAQTEITIRVDGTQAPKVIPTATPAATDPNADIDVELSETTIIFQSLSGSKTLTLKGAGDGNIVWSASSGKVVKMSISADKKSCVLTPIDYGSDTIYVSYAGKTYKCMVYVEKEVQLDHAVLTLKVGETAKLSVINAENATGKNLDTVWSTGNASIVSLSDKTMKTAIVKAESAGTTSVTKKYTYGDGSVKILECKVTVENTMEPGIVPKKLTLKVGETKTLTLQGVDESRVISWSAPDTVELTGKGLTVSVTGKKPGGAKSVTVFCNGTGSPEIKLYICMVTVVAAEPSQTPAPTAQPGKDSFVGEYFGVHTRIINETETLSTNYTVVVKKEADGTYTWEVGDDSIVPGDLGGYFIFSGGKANVSNGVLKGSTTDFSGSYSISISGGVCNYCFESAMDGETIYVTLYKK